MLLVADIKLSGTVWSAADRIRKLILRGSLAGRNPTARKKQQVTTEGF